MMSTAMSSRLCRLQIADTQNSCDLQYYHKERADPRTVDPPYDGGHRLTFGVAVDTRSATGGGRRP